MTSMMSSMGIKGPGSSSNSDSVSSSSDESKGKDDLFKSLKFSDDILQQMNAKRQEIVGGRKTLGTPQENTELNQRRGSFKKDIERGHIDIGAPLPQLLLIKSSPEIDSIFNEKGFESTSSTHDDHGDDTGYGLDKVKNHPLKESTSSMHDSHNNKDIQSFIKPYQCKKK